MIPVSAKSYDTNKTYVSTVVWNQYNLCRQSRVTPIKSMSAQSNNINKTCVSTEDCLHLNVCTPKVSRSDCKTTGKPTSTQRTYCIWTCIHQMFARHVVTKTYVYTEDYLYLNVHSIPNVICNERINFVMTLFWWWCGFIVIHTSRSIAKTSSG